MTSPGERARTFATALADAIDRRDVPLSWVRDRLVDRGTPVSLSALSYWRSGQREPDRRGSLDAVVELEDLLGLAAGDLARLLRPERERSAGEPVPFDTLLDDDAAGEALGEPDVDRVLIHQVLDVGADRRVVRRRATYLFVAAVDGASGVTMFLGPAIARHGEVAEIRPVSGCTIGETREVAGGSRAVQLAFDRPLAKDESVLVEVELRGGEPDVDATQAGVAAEQRLEEAMVWVRFHRDALPARSWVGFSEDGLEHEWEVDLRGATGLHHRQTGFGPGVCRVRWEWSDAGPDGGAS